MLSGFVCDERLLDYKTGSGAHVFSVTNDLIEPYFHIDNSLSKKRLFNLIKKLNLLDDLNLNTLLTPGRRNGVYAMLLKIKEHAKSHIQ